MNKTLDIVLEAALDKKARDIKVINLENITSIADYFVIMSGGSNRQVTGIADGITEKLKENGIRTHHTEGYQEAKWILLDLSDVVVHVFGDEDRTYYNLDGLWSDAPFKVIE